MQCTENGKFDFWIFNGFFDFEFYAEFKLLNWKASKLFCNFDISSSPSDFIAIKVHLLESFEFFRNSTI